VGIFTVANNESWEDIAKEVDVPLAALLSANGLSSEASNPPPAQGSTVLYPAPIEVSVAPANHHTVQSPAPDLLQIALDQLAAQALNFANVCISDAEVRANYLKRIAVISKEIRAQVDAKAITFQEGAEMANELRNDILAESRAASSAISRSVAVSEKPVGKTIQTLVDETLAKHFPGRGFNDLSFAERQVLFGKIIDASGRGSRKFVSAVPKLRIAGRACLIVTIAISAYTIWTADNKVRAGLHETIVLGGGFAGGAIAGAAAGLVCGPGAVVCSSVLFIVGGIAGSLAGEAVDSALDEQLNEVSRWFNDDGSDASQDAGATTQSPPSPSSDGGAPTPGAPDDADDD
jgi:hypothetical protein